MGGIPSSISGYVDVWKMDTFAEIDYQDDLRQQFETMRAFGRQEALTQSVRAGGFGGGAIGITSSMGGNANFWYALNNWMLNASLPSIPLALILGVWGYLASNRFLFFGGAFLLFFCIMNFFSLSQTQAARYSYKSKYFFTNLGVSIIAGVIAAVATPL